MSPVSEYWLLLRLHIKLRLRSGAAGKATPLRKLGIAFLVIYAAGAVVFMEVFMLLPIFRAAALFGELPYALFDVLLLLAMLVCLVLGTITLLSVVFLAKDTETYAAMPLRQHSVFAAKFSLVYIAELGTVIFLLAPAAGVFGYVVSPGPLFWLRLVFLALLLPVLPLAFSSLLALPLMRLFGRVRGRGVVGLVAGLLFLAGVMAGQMWLSARMDALFAGDALERFLQGNASAIMGFRVVFAPWVFLPACALALALALRLSSAVYYKAALAVTEAPKASGSGRGAGKTRAGSVPAALFKKEWKSILRSSVYAMNSLAGAVVFPLMLIMPAFGGSSSAGIFGALRESGVTDMTLSLVFAAVLGFVGSVNPAASTAFSRDGRGLDQLRALPLTPAQHLAGRMLCFHTIGTGSVLLCAAVMLFLPVGTTPVLWAALMGAGAAIAAAEASIIPDVSRPKTRWNSEAEAMKQNANSLLGMVYGLFIVLLLAGAAFLLRLSGSLPVVSLGVFACALLIARLMRLISVRLAAGMLAGD
jgi:ABC-2 type transport system permease protein